MIRVNLSPVTALQTNCDVAGPGSSQEVIQSVKIRVTVRTEEVFGPEAWPR